MWQRAMKGSRHAVVHSSPECVVCHSVGKTMVCESWAGKWHSACNHGYCSDCLKQLIHAELPKCSDNQHLSVFCTAENCGKRIPQRMVLAMSIEARMLANVIDFGPTHEVCAHCQYQCFNRRVIKNPSCEHSACLKCWIQWFSEWLPSGQQGCALDIPCIDRSCSSGCRGLLKHPEMASEVASCSVAGAIQRHLRDMDRQMSLLKGRNDIALRDAFGERVSASVVREDLFHGPACPKCNRTSIALLQNSNCQPAHAACSACWLTWFSEQAATVQTDYALDVPCIEPTCRQGCRSLLAFAEVAERPLCSRACIGKIRSHLSKMDREIARLRETNKLVSTLSSQSGQHVKVKVGRSDLFQVPTCPVCQETCLALLSDPDCDSSHAACETCWTRWAEEQIESCVAHRRLEARCMWPECTTRLSTSLGVWYHASTRSEAVRALTKKLERRAHLQRNPLYPAPVQVECPLIGCVGLGYLGYDTVMCFHCEHQWIPTEAGEPAGLPDVEKVMGVAVKKCPQCKEYIEKNGGCDHMTCRCKYEFYWSTLKPYRT